MAGKYLGDAFDIHGGGIDLRFPHHENELAQSTAAGQRSPGLWMHNAWINLAGEKMSKSLGNSMLVTEVVKRVRPIELRYYLVASHYRSNIEFSEESLDEAAAAFARIEGFVVRATELVGDVEPAGDVSAGAFAPRWTTTSRRPRRSPSCTGVIRDGNMLLADGDSDGTARQPGSRPSRCSGSSASTRSPRLGGCAGSAQPHRVA